MSRLPLLGLAGLALAAGVWAGLARLGWPPGPIPVNWVLLHGPLMISGFLGILISLERAIGLRPFVRWPWPFVGPALAALGTAALLAGLPAALGRGLLAASSMLLVGVFAVILRRQTNWAYATMAAGALAWLAGNAAWSLGRPVYEVTGWWATFLVFTIAGERLELARIWVRGGAALRWFTAAAGAALAGLLGSQLLRPLGLQNEAYLWAVRLTGLGWLGLGLWLLRYDTARRTLRAAGLTRYIAACLLPGYAWLALGGALWLARPERMLAGVWYDAALHTIFVGFVLSMIFAHAPLILPAIIGRALPYRPRFYLHLAVLHAGLALRLAGDLAALPALRQWGGLLNATALLIFVISSAAAVVGGERHKEKP